MQTLSIEASPPCFVVGSAAEPADRHAGDIDPDGEDPARQRLRGEYLRGEVVAERGDEDGAHVAAAEAGRRRIRARQRDAAVEPPVWGPPVEDAGRDPGTPVVALLVRGGSVGPADLLGRPGDFPPG